MEKINIKSISRKALIINVVILISSIILFRSLYYTADLINHEISYQNYLKEKQVNPFITEKDISPDKLKFPFYLYILLLANIILILEETYTLLDLYLKEKSINTNPP